MGTVRFSPSFGHANDLKGYNHPAIKPDSGGNMFALGVAYIFSKRTEAVAYYTQVSNQANGQYQFGLNPILPGVAITPGADSRGFMVGIRHLF
jgi:predicted porin